MSEENGAGNWLNIPKLYFIRAENLDNPEYSETCIFRVDEAYSGCCKITIFIDEKIEVHTATMKFNCPSGDNPELKKGCYYVYCPKIANFYLEFESKEKLVEYL